MLLYMLALLHFHCLISILNALLILFPSKITSVTISHKSKCIDILSYWNLRESLENKCPDWLPDYRWVTYDVKDGEGFYLQRSVFDRMAMAITKLNEDTKPWDLSRPTVMILPPFCNVPHWTYKSKRRLSWSTFYNIRQNKLPILEYDIYKRFIGTGNINVNVIGLNFDWSNKSIESNTSTEYYNKSEVSIFNHSNSKCAFDRYVRNANVIFGGNCELIKIDSLICISFFKLMRPKEVADELLELFKSNKECRKPQTYLIKHADGILVPWPWELKKYGILNILNYNDYIRRLANMYMYENSFFDQKKPYISVHLRRNDFVFVRNNDIPTFSQVLKRLLQLSNDLGISRVVMSTDGRKSEKDELKDIFLKHNLHLHIIDVKGNIEDGIISAVSQVILLHGEYFIGTKESRFSSSIAWDCILSNQNRGNDVRMSYSKCSEIFCGKSSEKQTICREHSDRLPLQSIKVA